jgi:hypothetical protein
MEIRDNVPKKYNEIGSVIKVALMVTMIVDVMKFGFLVPQKNLIMPGQSIMMPI